MTNFKKSTSLSKARRVPKKTEKRGWSPAGIVGWDRKQLSKGTTEHVLTVLKKHNKKATTELLSVLTDAVSKYHAEQALKSISKPTKVRENLAAANTSVESFMKQAALIGRKSQVVTDKLDSLDLHSRALLREVGQQDVSEYIRSIVSVQLQINDIGSRLSRSLVDALGLAKEYPSGRLPDTARLWLAVDVARAVKDCIGKDPTTSRSGLYVELLAAIIEAVTGEEANDPQDLAIRAIRAISHK